MPNSAFFNVQRLLVQEKGEDIYFALVSSKRQTASEHINDRIRRNKIKLMTDYQDPFNETEDNNMEDRLQEEERLKQKRQEVAGNKFRLVKYEMQRNSA